MYSWFLLNVAYPLYDLMRGRHLSRMVRHYRASQWFPLSFHTETQLILLQRLLEHAREHVPFYRERMRAAGLPSPLGDPLEALRALPPLTKRDIKDNLDHLRAVNLPAGRFLPGRTGGSTGEPTHFFYDRQALDFHRAALLLSFEWAQCPIGTRVCYFGGAHFNYTRSRQLLERLKNLIFRKVNLFAIDMSREALARKVEAIWRIRPKVLWGYASALTHLARFIEAEELGLPPLRSVITSSDTLFHPDRVQIERVMQCPVFDNYSSSEFMIAAECDRHTGYHIATEAVYIEAVDDDDRPVSARPGRILVTDLRNYTCPFIRYEIGDVGVMSDAPCECGRGLPLLRSLVGRVEDMIVTPSGRTVAPPAFTLVFSDVPSLDGYQLRQDRPEELEVLLIRRPDFRDADLRHLEHGLKALTNHEVSLSFSFVASIPRGESGKRRVVISKVRPQF